MTDYDGYRFGMVSLMEKDEASRLDRLIQAMKDEEVTYWSPSWEWHICDTCKGEGGHSHRLGVISPETWWEDWDDDDRDNYLSGVYDQPCDLCRGTGKVRLMDLDDAPADVRAWWEEDEKESYEYAATRYMEWMAGC